MKECIFCKIIRKEIPAKIIEKTDDLLVILSLSNHPLIITKSHIENIYELDDQLGAKVMKEAIKIAKACKKGLNCDGVNIVQNNEAASGQEVMHYHMHIKPRFSNDSVKLHLDTGETSDQEKKTTLEKIKSAL